MASSLRMRGSREPPVPLGHLDLSTMIIIELDQSILRRLCGTPHVFEKHIPRFRASHEDSDSEIRTRHCALATAATSVKRPQG
jgi:hypothetical protein